MTYVSNSRIVELDPSEIKVVDGAARAAAGRVFLWVGVVQAYEWVAEKAYEAGKWVGSQ